MATPLDVVIQTFSSATPNYELRLRGFLEGPRGVIGQSGTYRIAQVIVLSEAKVVLRAILAKEIDIPADLISKTGDPATLRKFAGDIDVELQGLAADAVRLFKARRDEALRRLRTIEIDWNAKTVDNGVEVEGAFLTTAGTFSATAKGEAGLALAFYVSDDTTSIKGAALAEFRLSVGVQAAVAVVINGVPQTLDIDRSYGVVCRIGFEAAATLSFDLDDFNLSLPEVRLPHFDLSTFAHATVDVTLPLERLAGAFSRLTEELDIKYTWKPSAPEIAVLHSGGKLLFAVMESGLSDADYDLAQYSAASPPKLAKLDATITSTKPGSDVEVTAADVTLARLADVVLAGGTLTARGAIGLGSGSRVMGPLRIQWDNVRVRGAFEASDATVRASITFDRILIHPIDDPSAVLAFRGEIELTQSGTRVVELQLVEPYPFVLVARGAAALLRGVEKIIQILGELEPTQADLAGLRKVMDVLGRIAAAVARSALFIVSTVAELIAQAVIKIAEVLVEALKRLGSLIPTIDDPGDVPKVRIDVEVRIALDPIELRQIMLTLHGEKIDPQSKVVTVLGFRFEVPDGWRPALLVDFVTEPGAYLLAIRPTAGDATKPFATVSTDLWMKRPDAPKTVAPMHDASSRDGERDPEKPLFGVAIRQKVAGAAALVIAGVSRGEIVLLRQARNAVTEKQAKLPGDLKVAVVDGPFALVPIGDGFEVDIQFEPKRVLPLLGMGEPGKEPAAGNPSFLERLQAGLGQVVTIEETRFPKEIRTDSQTGRRSIAGAVVLGIRAAGVATRITVDATLDVDTFEVTLKADDVFPVMSRRIQERALGLTWVVEQTDEKALKENAEVEMFQLAFAGGESGFELTRKARMELRFDGLSSDGEGVVFEVETFRIGRGGLDVTAKVVDRPVRLSGINVPFRFTSGRFVIRGGRLVEAVVVGRGQLPPELVGEANCTIMLAFELANGEIALKNGSKVELEKMGEPIVCHGTRFTLTITHLELGFARDGGYHFYFLVTGSLRFTPKSGEFEDGLLKHLADIEITLENAPLTGDPRVLLKHIRFQKELKPKKTFPLFNLFTFELRGFGFHPASPKFEGNPAAVNISGQVRFAELGDVMQPKIDFHGLWIAPPKKGESLPRIKADGLGVDLQLAGSVKIRGAVLAVDPDTKTVEGRDFAPKGYDTYGFLGEGAVDIPGFCSIEASLGFLEVEKQDQPGERKIAFFLFLQANKLAVEIPTPVWTFYLREAGFGFGYRYTLAGIKDAESARSAGELVRILDDVSKRQGDLSRFASWKPDPEKDNVTLALRGAFQTYAAEKTYNETREKEAVNPFFFDIVAALRSDFTFLLSARGWLGVNYATFLENKDNFRERPGFRGYLYISVPRSELLLRGIADSKGFIGQDWPEVKEGPLREAVQSVDWTTTLYIRPGLFHYEMGWPDQLAVRLVDKPNMRVVVRGGMIFRASDEGLLFGYNIGADAFIRFEGRAGGSIGVALVAELKARFVARVLAFIAANFRDSLVYGLVSLDARLTFSVEAWMDVDLGFTSFTIRIGFSFSVQFTASIELAISPAGVGGRVEARISVQVFGCSLGVGIGFAFNQGRLDEARARVQRFLAMSITAEEPNAPPVFGATKGDEAINSSAAAATVAHTAPPKPPETPVTGPKPPVKRALFGREIRQTDFFLVLRRAGAAPDGKPAGADMAYALFVPKEAASKDFGGFYSAPSHYETGQFERSEAMAVHRIRTGVPLNNVEICVPGQDLFVPFQSDKDIPVRWNAPIPVTGGGEKTFTLAFLFDECFLTDTRWEPTTPPTRVAEAWAEPETLRRHGEPDVSTESGDARKQERELQQKAQLADAIAHPFDDRAFQARSTAMTMFLDQFVSLAATGRRTKVKVGSKLEAHVTDLGLVLYGKAEELEKLNGQFLVKVDGKGNEQKGEIEVFNPRDTWFERRDPVLGADCHAVDNDGVKLDWRLSLSLGNLKRNPEQLLQHYEILRTIEGSEFTPCVMNVKPCATVGERNAETGAIRLIAPDWQFNDALAEETGVSPTMRRALLPVFGEAEGLEAAKAWIQAFGNAAEVTLTYTVTPVDTAGTSGLPRSFTVDIRRPEVPIRPAIGELRIVQTIPDFASQPKGAEGSDKPPRGMEVYLALDDRAWDDDALDEMPIGDATFKVRRFYRVIRDPEDIEPAGYYGSNAVTSRLRGPGAFAPTVTADETPVKVPREATVRFDHDDAREEIRKIEPDLEERRKLPRWARLSFENFEGAEENVFPREEERDRFHAGLWTRPDGTTRVATRFFLETVLRFEHPSDKTRTVEFKSKRVELPVEHVIIAKDRVHSDNVVDAEEHEKGQAIAALRPEAFEPVVPLVLPPLGDGQVDAESGFARFRVPRADARLGDLGDAAKDFGLRLERDPERRVLTTVRFAAVPDWVSAQSNGAAEPEPVHGRSMAGYELYELDLDELAPLDTTKDVTVARDAKAWRRARRVARIEQLSRADAQLAPSGNTDWQGWQAHYPSETARVERARDGDLGGDSRPIRAPWYSERETTAHFAERRLRLRLLPLVPETAIAELMREGKPHRLSAWLVMTKDSRIANLVEKTGGTFPAIRTHSVNVGPRKPPEGLPPLDLAPLFKEAAATLGGDDKPPATAATFSKKTQTEAFDSGDLRNLLLCLGWAPFRSASETLLLSEWLADPTSFDGLKLVLQGEGDFLQNTAKATIAAAPATVPIVAKTGRVEIPLDLRSQVHPILEEMLGELALRNRAQEGATPLMYRHFNVIAQPVTPPSARDIESLMAATAPEADPYGWQVLQTLGSATTVRLYDLAAEEFVGPALLATRVDSVLASVLGRWRSAYDELTFEKITGRVFTEVFLQPGRDRLAGPFDSVIDGSVEAEKPEKIVADDEGLAFMQVSLRPRPVAVWTYMRQQLGWRDVEEAVFSRPGHRLVGMSIRLTSKGRAMDVARPRGGAAVELTKDADTFVSIPIPAARRAKTDADREIELYFRVEDGATAESDRPAISLALEFQVVDTSGEKPVNRVVVEVMPLSDDKCPLTAPGRWMPVEEPAVLHPDPFDRFAAIPVEKWIAAYEGTQAKAVESLAALRNAAHGAGLEVPASDGTPAKPTATRQIVGTYLNWAQRFLDHGVSRKPDPSAADARPTEPFVAICAPIKATPWRLAADVRGTISLSFLHADRWGHARAYAVKPVSRYHELLAGIGVRVQQEASSFVPEKGFARDVGVAVAVSPRTERIEAPVIMSSRVLAKSGVAEVIVARHGEESLSMSNRPLLAHLGMPASLIAFGRAYRTPDWPARMNAFFDPSQQKPTADTLPARAAALPADPPQVLEHVRDSDVRELASELPGLWKGADIWRIPPLAPHYKLITLTSERAGIVVSEVTGVVLDEFPRRELDGDGRADALLPEEKVTLSLTRIDQKVRLVLLHPLITHQQVTPVDLLPQATPDDDVSRWPDPDVVYVLLRRLERNDGITEKEDAEIRLVAAGPVDAAAQPVVIRPRGTDYSATLDPVVGFESQASRAFVLRSRLDRADSGIQAALLDPEELASGSIDDFNTAAADLYAAILTPHETTIDLPVIAGEGGPVYLGRLKTFLAQLEAGITQHLGSVTERWYDEALTSQARGRAAALANWIATNGTSFAATATEAEVREAAGLPIVLSAPWRRKRTLPDLVAGEAAVVPWNELADITGGSYLAVFDLASDEDLATKLPQSAPPVAKPGRRLFAMLAARVLGPNTGFWLKAIDARSRMTIEAGTAKTTAVIERRITKLPECFRKEA